MQTAAYSEPRKHGRQQLDRRAAMPVLPPCQRPQRTGGTNDGPDVGPATVPPLPARQLLPWPPVLPWGHWTSAQGFRGGGGGAVDLPDCSPRWGYSHPSKLDSFCVVFKPNLAPRLASPVSTVGLQVVLPAAGERTLHDTMTSC